MSNLILCGCHFWRFLHQIEFVNLVIDWHFYAFLEVNSSWGYFLSVHFQKKHTLEVHKKWWDILGCPPSQYASHHQDYYIFRIGDPNLNLHLPQASWEGGQPKGYWETAIPSFSGFFFPGFRDPPDAGILCVVVAYSATVKRIPTP